MNDPERSCKRAKSKHNTDVSSSNYNEGVKRDNPKFGSSSSHEPHHTCVASEAAQRFLKCAKDRTLAATKTRARAEEDLIEITKKFDIIIASAKRAVEWAKSEEADAIRKETQAEHFVQFVKDVSLSSNQEGGRQQESNSTQQEEGSSTATHETIKDCRQQPDTQICMQNDAELLTSSTKMKAASESSDAKTKSDTITEDDTATTADAVANLNHFRRMAQCKNPHAGTLEVRGGSEQTSLVTNSREPGNILNHTAGRKREIQYVSTESNALVDKDTSRNSNAISPVTPKTTVLPEKHKGTVVTVGEATKVFKLHTKQVQTATVLPNHSQFLSGSADTVIFLWDVSKQGKECLQSFYGHTEMIASLSVLPPAVSSGNDTTITTGKRSSSDGTTTRPHINYFISGSYDKKVKLWNIRSGKCIQSFIGHDKAVVTVCAIDSDRFLSASFDGHVKIWDVRNIIHRTTSNTTIVGESSSSSSTTTTTNPIVSRSFTSVMTCIELVDATKDQFLSGFDNKEILLWNIQDGILRQFGGHTKAVSSVAMLPPSPLSSSSSSVSSSKEEELHFASGSWDTTLKIWNLTTGTCIHTLHGHTNAVYKVVVLSRVDDTIISGSGDKSCKIWNWKQGVCIHTIDTGHKRSINDIAVMNDTQFVTVSGDKTIKLWNVCIQ